MFTNYVYHYIVCILLLLHGKIIICNSVTHIKKLVKETYLYLMFYNTSAAGVTR